MICDFMRKLYTYLYGYEKEADQCVPPFVVKMLEVI